MNADLRAALKSADRVAPNGNLKHTPIPKPLKRLQDERMLRIKLMPDNVAVLEELLRGLGDPQPADWIEEFVDRNEDAIKELTYDVVAVYNSHQRDEHYATKEDPHA